MQMILITYIIRTLIPPQHCHPQHDP
ncbi:conserved hypothetical protein [Burkholderia cenocepacia]|nr:conserved hypothetical protein [Burkholderia cenocepacia]